eukprot:Gregarina_sp_Poly_1__1484@NODE_1371_length_4272_cov_409_771225_g159_i3_p1_GENE_NODE_1371_length_4272_cov_409_771225_g159_i3NODE_1371_length_4272_cov_409_771225_g159_i3_p1_ORF_typecomplete_len1323_score245_79ABC_tran/PF00005_27/8_2e44ABC_tran/PF00005_27/3_6e38ABC_membrane/PF00664_23/1_3e40ABC_membrane/PF00664_23/2_7e41SMC_N/PF02463_19/33SMC_N/PF02463_19/1_6e06SMC_N/PF02463_19/6_8SMC_N/PF02463_19/0_0013AAA_21/PF13304_6/0_00027AAA_21/PF13304_6/1_8e06TniB/PF05621_11/0_0016TniB/PF05621_11/0_029TniB/P
MKEGDSLPTNDGGSPKTEPSNEEVPPMEEKEKAVSPFLAWRFADKIDIILIVIGNICAAGIGILPPMNFIIMGNAFSNMANMSWDIFVTMCTMFLVLGCVALVGSLICGVCLEASAERQIYRAKSLYFQSLVRQEIGYFDTRDIGTLAADVETSSVQLRDGVGLKSGRIVRFVTTFFGGYIVGLWKNWRMALVLTAVIPLIGLTFSAIIFRVQKSSTRARKEYEKAGAIAEEALPAIRTVAAFGLESDFSTRFSDMIKRSLKSDLDGVGAKSVGVGLLFLFLFSSYALGWWYGGSKVIVPDVRQSGMAGLASTGNVLTCFFSILMASFSMGQISPPLSSLAVAAKAAVGLMETISRESAIDPNDTSGDQPAHDLKGEIEFRHVEFAFPTRLQRPVYKNVSFTMNAGERVALVGPSGAGKSTVVQLIQRFYDPQSGEILIDGKRLTDYNLQWLRSQMALVSQEPKLFCTSIYQNIAYGKQGASESEIIEAAKQANAHDFVMSLPHGYNTNVGQGGSLLSGGQKQRIAIARAILRDPSILILDEATSALDNQSEKVVQAALDKLLETKKRTTIIIAHRLTTIRNADKIIVVENVAGEGSLVTEQGTHDELMRRTSGTYHGLVTAQQMVAGSTEDLSVSIAANKALAHRLSKEMSRTPRMFDRVASKGSASRLSSVGDVQIEHRGKIRKPRKRDLFQYLGRDKYLMYIAIFSSAVVGAAFPFVAVMVAKFLNTFTTWETDVPEYMQADANADRIAHNTRNFALVFVYLAVGVGFFFFLGDFLYGYTGERLVATMRNLIFGNMLHQDMEFFDNPQHNTGFLSSVLSADCETARMITGANLSIQIQNAFRLLIAVGIGFYTKPLLALVSMALYFIAVPASLVQSKFTRTTAIDISKLTDEESPAFVLNEAITNLRTIAAYGLQQNLFESYVTALKCDLKKGRANAWVAGIAAGITDSVIFFANSLSFFYAGKLMTASPPELNVEEMMRTVIAIMLAGQGLTQATEWTTDSKKAKAAINNMMFILKRQPKMDARSSEGHVTPVEGRISLDHVKFRYPGRPTQSVLGDVSFQIKRGETVALVGESGSGKSTIIQFLERFYDCEPSDSFRVAVTDLRQDAEEGTELKRLPSVTDMFGGKVLIDNKNITHFNLKHLRAQFGLVGQEPVLFDMSVKENIRNGKKDATEEEIIAAAKAANAHDFIVNLDEGYDTNVGKGGGKLSGGQKQRVAIARAIVRDPKILLLDEATSALDPESEEVVQKALDVLMQESKRTTVVIAHRLSTIRNADKIVVFGPQPGVGSKVVEAGTHDELMNIPGGVYRNLVEIAADRS